MSEPESSSDPQAPPPPPEAPAPAPLITIGAIRAARPIGKGFALARGGKLISWQAPWWRALPARADNIVAATLIEALQAAVSQGPEVMLLAGTWAPEHVGHPVVFREAVSQVEGAVAPTKEFLAFREGPGLLRDRR